MNEKVLKVIEAAKSRLGNPYVFGMWGRKCTPSVRRQYAGYNPNHKSAIFKACPVLSGKKPSCDGCKWQDALAFDCRGFTYWCLLTGYGKKLQGGGCTSQWGYRSNWLQQGVIQNMPDVVCCVFQYNRGKYQHTGLHIGGGVIIHCAYNDAGVQYGHITDKGWTHYAIPTGLYSAAEIVAAGKAAETAAANLCLGSTGADVTKLQQALNALGYDCGDADGIFGAATEAAVRAFQRDHDLAVDGIADKDTQTALYAAEDTPKPTYTVTLHGMTEANAKALTQQYGGEMTLEA